jgi:hypothetical protein
MKNIILTTIIFLLVSCSDKNSLKNSDYIVGRGVYGDEIELNGKVIAWVMISSPDYKSGKKGKIGPVVATLRGKATSKEAFIRYSSLCSLPDGNTALVYSTVLNGETINLTPSTLIIYDMQNKSYESFDLSKVKGKRYSYIKKKVLEANKRLEKEQHIAVPQS